MLEIYTITHSVGRSIRAFACLPAFSQAQRMALLIDFFLLNLSVSLAGWRMGAKLELVASASHWLWLHLLL